MQSSTSAVVCWRPVLGVFLASVFCGGCSSEPPPARENIIESHSPSDADDPARHPTGDEIDLRLGSWDDVQRFIASQRGKIVVVNVWSTTCGACAEEFPRFVELQRKYERNDVVCVSFNCDYDGIRGKPPEFYRDGVQTFLADRKATTINFLSSVAFTDLIEPPVSLTFPQALVYGHDGILVKRFDNEQLEGDQNPSIFMSVAAYVAELRKEG